MATTITDYFIKNNVIMVDKKEVYIYGFEVLLSSMVYIAILIGLSIITNTFLESIIFFIGFYIYRTLAGGYHARTYLKCHFLFLTNHLAFIILYKLYPSLLVINLSYTFVLVSVIFLFLFAPVDMPQKPFVKTEKMRFTSYCRIYGTILLVTSSLLVLMRMHNSYNILFCFAVGSFSAAISLLSAKIIYRKEKTNHEKG